MEEQKNKKEQPEKEAKTFRWLLSIIGEVLLVVPIVIILLLMGSFFN